MKLQKDSLHTSEEIAALSGRLSGWTIGDGTGHQGYNVHDYFDGERYLGADQHGIEPIFAGCAAISKAEGRA